MKEYLRFMWKNHPGRLFTAGLLAIPLYVLLGSWVFTVFPKPEGAGPEGVTVVSLYIIFAFALALYLIITGVEFFIEMID